MPKPAGKIDLHRRGVRHGAFVPAPPPSSPLDARERFAANRAVHFPGVLRVSGARRDRRVAETMKFFADVRRGGGLADFVRRRLEGNETYRFVGASVDAFDAREVEKFYVHEIAKGRVVAKDLYAKLSWISEDPKDVSLRVRFSFGSETLGDWTRDARRAKAADRFAEAAFPEGATLARNARLRRFIERGAGGPVRFSERIVYSNAPGGGAEFHHDAEPLQLGVLYGQLQGETAWLALPKRELAEALSTFGVRGKLAARLKTPSASMRALDAATTSTLGRVLDATPRFTAALAARGALIRLRKGDALVLPSAGPDDCCWHAVFALGRTPSLAFSYGIFAERPRLKRPSRPDGGASKARSDF